MNPQEIRISCEVIPKAKTAQFTPNRVQKVVHLIRHGQGTHNAFATQKHKEGTPCRCVQGQSGCPYVNKQFTDARLTLIGRKQAAEAGAALLQTSPVPEAVFVSPLWRTLETATIALSRCPNLKVPLIAEENLRERNGVHFCDKRSPTDQAQAGFPTVDFGRLPPGPDTIFSPEIRETEEELAARGKDFFLSLRHRPEKSFAVFSHSSFLYNTLSREFDFPKQDVLQRFQTGEHRAVLLTYSS